MVSIPVKRLDPGVALPTVARAGDAGLDLTAAETVTVAPGGGRALIPTGFAMALPEGFAALVLPRSGLARKHGLTVLNTPGLIDAGYRGEIAVLVINTDPHEPVTLERGDRIAQLVIQRVVSSEFVEVDELTDSDRGEAGWGSTG